MVRSHINQLTVSSGADHARLDRLLDHRQQAVEHVREPFDFAIHSGDDDLPGARRTRLFPDCLARDAFLSCDLGHALALEEPRLDLAATRLVVPSWFSFHHHRIIGTAELALQYLYVAPPVIAIALLER